MHSWIIKIVRSRWIRNIKALAFDVAPGPRSRGVNFRRPCTVAVIVFWVVDIIASYRMTTDSEDASVREGDQAQLAAGSCDRRLE